MKTSLTKSKSSFIFVAALLTQVAWAKPVAQVVEVSGQVFAVTPAGKTVILKVNDHIEEKSEIMTEEGSAITLNDYYDATYHLIGGSHLKFFNKSAQLKRGKTWVQAQSGKHQLAFVTANGQLSFSKSEFIVTFEQARSRSQVLVVNGDVEVSNILEKEVKQTVTAGSFTLIDPEVENGMPRFPTKIGLQSLNAALGEFKKLPKNMTASAASRSIASVPTTTTESSAAEVAVENAPKKGEIIFITSTRAPASVKGDAYKYFKKSIGSAKKKSVVSAPEETIPVRYFGFELQSVEVVAPQKFVPRQPASVIKNTPVPVPFSSGMNHSVDQEFADSLKKQVIEQPKHSKELESLIQDLKSY